MPESPEAGKEARALGYSIFTQADSIEELNVVVSDAVSCHFASGEIKLFVLPCNQNLELSGGLAAGLGRAKARPYNLVDEN